MKTLVATTDKSAYHDPMTTTPTTDRFGFPFNRFSNLTYEERRGIYCPITFDSWYAVEAPEVSRVVARFTEPWAAINEAARLNEWAGLTNPEPLPSGSFGGGTW